MKKILIGAAITAALVLIPTKAGAASAQDNGNEWLGACGSGSHGQEMWCLGYTQGLSHGYDMLAAYSKVNLYCTGSKSVTIGQLRDIMRNYLYRNPAKRSDSMMMVYIGSMQESFPCQ
jgi:hypothetical protein